MGKGRLLDRAPGAASRAKSVRQEKSTARDMGGRVTPGSGNQWHAKGDVKTPKYLVECKTTDKESFSLTDAVLRKIALEAVKTGKLAVLQVDVGGRSYAVVDWALWLELSQMEVGNVVGEKIE